ncbi:MAG: ankyrin repeat domain-containing protein [Candidatus Margulisbacteria bacterium]|nr:ankyrin repeat domain-containing protein [Candidatus Margulisiibacteriota bacterium]
MARKVIAENYPNNKQVFLKIFGHYLNPLEDNINIFKSKMAESIIDAVLEFKSTGGNIIELFASYKPLGFLNDNNIIASDQRDAEAIARKSMLSCLKGLNTDNKHHVLRKLTRDMEILHFSTVEEQLSYCKEWIEAASNGDLETVKSFIHKRIPIEMKDDNGRTALPTAVFNGHKEIVELLIKNGADVNTIDNTGTTPLMWAAFRGYTEIVDLLLEKNADVKARSIWGTTALMQVANGNNDLNLLKKLIDFGAEVNMQNNKGETALFCAVKCAKREMIAELARCGAKVNAKTKSGFSPMLRASLAGMPAVVRLLIRLKANLNDRDVNLFTPLMFAAREGYTEIAIDLLEAGADVNLVNKEGDTALILAVRKGLKSTVKELLARKAQVDVVNTLGKSPLQIAEANGLDEIAEMIKAELTK